MPTFNYHFGTNEPYEKVEANFIPNLQDPAYIEQLKARMQDRLTYVLSLDEAEGGFNKLPADAAEAIKRVVDQANTL